MSELQITPFVADDQPAMPSRDVQPFSFDGHSFRVIDQDGQPWFTAVEVCAALKISNPRDAIAKLDHDEKGVALTDTLGGEQNVAIINEGGLYTLTLRCRDAMKPGTAPHRFRKFITAEVLPSIRKTGAYATPARAAPASLSRMEILQLAMDAERDLHIERGRRIEVEAAKTELEHHVEVIGPKAAIYDKFLNADGLIGLQDLGRVLGEKPNKFIDRLKPRYLFDQGGVPTPRQEFVERGIFRVTSVLVGEKIRKRTWATAKGVQYFAKKLEAEQRKMAA